MRITISVVLLLGFLTGTVAAQEKPSSPKTTTATCTFQDGKEISVRYERAAYDKKKFADDTPYSPGNSQLLLFTQTGTSLGTTEIPTGAYSMYVIPGKKEWTLVVSRNITAGSPYDQQQDVVRAPAQIGHLSDPVEHFKIAFAHVAPKQCNMRMNFGKTGSWVEFKEK